MPQCSLCGSALTKDEIDEQYDTCGTCRSPAGKLQELWLAIQTGPQNGQELIPRCGPAAIKLMAILEVWFGRIGNEALIYHFVRWLEGNRLVDSPEHARWMTIAKAVAIAADAAAGKTSMPPDAVGGSERIEADSQPKVRKRGRRKGAVDSDPNKDRRIAEAWAKRCGEYASLNDVAKAFGMEKCDVIAALDRHRKRLPKSEINRTPKRRQVR